MAVSTKLCLGTVQFGLKYGVVGRGAKIPLDEIEGILERAWSFGIRDIDTAPVYGEAEKLLTNFLSVYPFDVVSKISVINASSLSEIDRFIKCSINDSRVRLGNSLKTLLFHSSDDLLGEYGEFIWKTATTALLGTEINLGVSCYSPQGLQEIQKRYPVKVAQLPGNALDQRFSQCADSFTDTRVYLRSIFLQGLLLCRVPDLPKHLSKSLLRALHIWNVWCENNNLSLIQGAISVVKFLSGVSYCVVGVDSLKHLEEIMLNWNSCTKKLLLPPAIQNLDVIDPRRW